MKATTAPLRLVIFEDVTVVRDMLVEVFSGDARYEVVGAFEEGAAGVKEAIRLRPNIALVDYVLPGLDGITVAERLMTADDSVKVVLTTAHDRPEVLLEAIDRGIHGVVTKGSPLRILKEAVSQVVENGAYYCPATSSMLREARGATRRDPLTARERDVVRLIASGRSNKQIASELRLSEKTVGNHRTNAMRKVGVREAASLTRYAVERGLVPGSTPRGGQT